MFNYDNETILSRISLINEYLKNLKELSKLPLDSFLGDYKNYYTAERLLQLAIECCIDIGSHLISKNTLGKPSSYRDIFTILIMNNFLPKKNEQRYHKIVGFRNILVHHYLYIERETLYSILKENLDDIKDFVKIVIKNLDLKT